ncbi:MAG: hypothetical protein JWP06_45 [Candidatus Saccharibacteria bacterium]|nr:hypothetical protein [Candidatus Saccharibacteria bacterium]
MSSTQPKHRKKLNSEQVDILELLYRFRFASCKQIASYQHKQTIRPVQNRLKILEDQGFIAKRYDKTYKLRGKPAAYYLLPRGVKTLDSLIPREPHEPINFKQIYRNMNVSENFVEHCSNVLQVYLVLKQQYLAKDNIIYRTKSRLNYECYDYLPSSLPDAYIRLGDNDDEPQFFLDIFEDTQPFFVLIRKLKTYFKYSEDGDWSETGTMFPTILMACANTSMQKRLRKRIAKELQDSYEEITFATTTLETIKNNESVKIWLPIDEDGDDPAEPPRPLSLLNL